MVRALSSLRLAVVLFALSIVLIFAGTLAQRTEGVWTVVDGYFRSLWVMIPLSVFAPGDSAPPGAIPFPGGLTLGVMLFINLLAAHAARFKLSWKRTGIILAHAGVLLLLVGEFVTGAFSREGNMAIVEGGSANYTESIRAAEIAVTDTSRPEADVVTVIPQWLLEKSEGLEINDPKVPVVIRVDEWMSNSRLLGPMQATAGQLARATRGIGTTVAAVPIPRATGVDGQNVDIPSAYVRVRDDRQDLGTLLLSVHHQEPQTVESNGRIYRVALRFARDYRPYTIHLKDFRHDRFVGTDKPRNFSSQVRLVDPVRKIDREVTISMNEPLRHAGETFYQAAFMEGDSGTVLQVVRNPGWIIPYASCTIITLGLLVHFGVRFSQSVGRKAR
jgi:hypothetical protein